MLLTIICIIFFAGSIRLLVHACKKWDDDIGGWFIFVVFGLLFTINIACLFICPLSTRCDIKRFEAARTTIDQQRQNIRLSEFERVQLTESIIKQNQWLAAEQFWAKSIWLNWYYDKSILDVKPIQ